MNSLCDGPRTDYWPVFVILQLDGDPNNHDQLSLSSRREVSLLTCLLSLSFIVFTTRGITANMSSVCNAVFIVVILFCYSFIDHC